MDIKVWDFFEILLLCIIRVKFNVSESKKVDIVWKNLLKIMKMVVLVFYNSKSLRICKVY